MVPVAEPQSIVGWPTAKIDNQGEDKQAQYRDDFDTGENELSFPVDRHDEDVEADDQHLNKSDPCRWSDLVIPELNNDSSCRNLSAELQGVRIPVVPADSETHGIVNMMRAVLLNSTW